MKQRLKQDYINKLPYITLISFFGITAGCVYFNEFRLSQLALSILIAHLVILNPNRFCLAKKSDSFDLLTSLKASVFPVILLVTTTTIMSHFGYFETTNFGLSFLIVFFLLFPIVVEKSRYT